MRFKLFFGLCCILCSPILYSQIVEPSSGVDKQVFQIETEAQYAVQKEGMTKQVAWSLPSMLFRYGLLQDVELQLNVPLIIEQLYENDHLAHNINSLPQIQVGGSINLWNQSHVIPEAAFMAKVILPVKKGDQFLEDGAIIALNFSNTIIEKWSLNYNIGYVHGTDSTNTGYYIVNLTYDLNQNGHFFLENFCDFNSKTIFSQNINVGGGINVKKNIGLDFSVANGINHNLFYTSLRLTWVLNTKK
jgi:hypothetical protein